MESRIENAFTEPYKECLEIIMKLKIKDQFSQELIDRRVHILKVCDRFFDRFSLLRNQGREAYNEAFNGYKDAKQLKDMEKLNVSDQKLNRLIEEYQITRNDLDLFLESSLSEKDRLLFNASVGRIYRKFMYAIKNTKGLGFFKEANATGLFQFNLEFFDLYTGSCMIQGFDRELSFLLQESDRTLFESQRGACYYGAKAQYLEPNELRVKLIFEAQDLIFENEIEMKVKKRKLPLHLMEEQRIK